MKSKDTQKAELTKEKVLENKNTAKDKGYTDDGFKIASSIPEDDSDVSDAFESCSEEEEEEEEEDATTLKPHHRKEDDTPSAKKPKKTEDGFKIVTEIPPDDSDVSDAFEDDEDSVDMSSSCQKQKTVAKPILQIMNDFGIDSRTLTDRRENTPKQPLLKLSKKQKKLRNIQANTVTQAAKVKKQNDVQIFNYANKRGVNKDKKPKEEEQEDVEQSLTKETLDEKQLKRVRYDVFRLGMSGFHKEKKEDTRVALAIKLGAKPPRKKAVNYKKFQEMKKEEKKREAEERQTKLKLGLKVPKPFKKKDKPVVKAAASQIGRYKHGVQVISKRDISKISKS
ncbi:DNA ligase 1-like [Scylla paramamosain]|uniref:DNA ligase 1-like n=1 Tax=Scylla paramamosain TaxID=85552 RepID=UPI003082DE32